MQRWVAVSLFACMRGMRFSCTAGGKEDGSTGQILTQDGGKVEVQVGRDDRILRDNGKV